MKNNWQVKKLGEIIKLEYGKPLSSTDRGMEGKYPVYGANGIKGRSNKYHFDRSSIIVGRKGSAGEINLVEEKFWPLDVTYYITFNESLYDLKFLYHLLSSLELPKLAKGVKPGINRNDIYSIEVRMPSLPEQQWLVKILDETFGEIAKIKDNTAKSLQNSKELFEIYLKGVFTGLQESWTNVALEDISKIVNGYSFSSKDFSSTNTIKSIKITNVGVKEFIEGNTNYLPDKFKNTLADLSVKQGDIVLALTRTIISSGLKVAIVPESYNGALLNQRVAALIPYNNLINTRYLYNFLCTPIVSDYVLSNVNELMQPNLSISDLKKLSVPCPPLFIQESIVSKLDLLSIETKKLESIYKRKMVILDELKESILYKAFSGGL